MFIAWDTEGKGQGAAHRTILLANSTGANIYNESGIPWQDSLDFLCHHAGAVNVWFAFGYDVNMLFKNMPQKERLELFKDGETFFSIQDDKYKIKYIPRKVLRIKKNKTEFVHYDVWGFYQSSFIKMLNDWKIELPSVIIEGKKLRQSEFECWSVDQIKEYNNQECLLLVQAMDKLYSKMVEASNAVDFSLVPSSWHGAGAIAPLLLQQVKCAKHKKFKPSFELHTARKHAYFGGRVELFRRGAVGKIYNYDINSAYPSACRFLPSFENKEFLHTTDFKNYLEEDSFAIVKVKWNIDSRVGPLPYRLKNNYVVFPEQGSGWYHWIEVQSALKKGYKIELLDAYILPKPYNFFMRETIEKVAQKRLEFKEKKDLANVPLKLGLNSLYGKLAQRPTQAKSTPQFLELLYAGFITAHCRAQILNAINVDSIVLIATDGIFSTTDLKLQTSNELGGWESKVCKNAIFLLAGIYCYENEKGELVEKTRGFRQMIKGDHTYSIQDVYHILQKGGSFTSKDNRFIGTKLANTSNKYIDCGFQEIERVIDWNNNIKRAQFFDDGDSIPFQNSSEAISAEYKLQFEEELKDQLYVNDLENTENYQ